MVEMVKTRTVRLEDVAYVNPRLSEKIDPSTFVSFVGMADLSADRAVTEAEDARPYSEVAKGYTPFQDGDLLVAKITPCFENGKIGQARLSRKLGFGSTEFHVVRPHPELADSRFLLHFLRSPQFRAAGEMRMTGSGGQRRVPVDYVKQAQLYLPPLDEQRRIAAIMDKADALRIKRRQALAYLDVLTQSIFHSTFGDPISNPMRWPIVSVGDALESAKYGSSEKAALVGATPVLRMNNLTYGGQLDLSQMKYLSGDVDEKYLVRSGDVLFNRTNSAELVGKTAVYTGPEPMAYAGYLVRLRTRASCRPHFLGTFMNLPSTKKTLRNMCKSIVGMANINAQEVQTVKMPLPPVEKQNDFEARLLAISQLKDRHRAQLAELEALFASLQHRAFRGELS